MLLQHHDLDHNLVLLRGGVVWRRRGQLRLDVLLRVGELVHEGSEFLELRDEKLFEWGGAFRGRGD